MAEGEEKGSGGRKRKEVGFPIGSVGLSSAVMSSAISTLVPGYDHVEQFGDDDEYERDENGNVIEEVEYVTLDVGVVEPTLVPSTTAYRLIVRVSVLRIPLYIR